MSEYTSTRHGFERAMKWSLTGPPKDAKLYAESTAVPNFYHVMNGQRIDYDAYVENIATGRAKISDYKPSVKEFLRDGDQLAARMTGTIKVDGADTTFECFMFAKVDKESGRMEWLIERAVWGPLDAEPEHGINSELLSGSLSRQTITHSQEDIKELKSVACSRKLTSLKVMEM